MDHSHFLKTLCDLPVEEGRTAIVDYLPNLDEYTTFGMLMKNEAQYQECVHPLNALKLADLLIFFGEYVQHPALRAYGYIARGNILKSSGYHHMALECSDIAAGEFLQLGDEIGWARSRISWIISAAYLGRVEEALEEAQRARAVFSRLQQLNWLCALDINVAVLYTQLGRYQDAIDLYAKLLTIYRSLGEQDDKIVLNSAIARMNQARNLGFLGQFEQAYDLYQQVRGTFTQLDSPHHVILTEINLADLEYIQGYYGSALRRYYHAHDLYSQRAIDNHLLLAHIKLWMANCFARLNRFVEACQKAEEAVVLHRQLGTSLETGDALCEYATTLIASRRLDKAIEVLDEAEKLHISSGFAHHALAAKLQRAQLLLEMGAVDQAYAAAQEASVFFDEHCVIARSVHANIIMADALLQKVRTLTVVEQAQQDLLLQQALEICYQASSQALLHHLGEYVYQVQHLLGTLFFLQGNTRKAARHYLASIVQIERILVNLSYDLSPAFLRRTWEVYADIVVFCLQQQLPARALHYLERARSVELRQYLQHSNRPLHAVAAAPAKYATLLRLQRDMVELQQTYRQYSTQLATYATNPDYAVFDSQVARTELQRCEERLSEIFEQFYLVEHDLLQGVEQNAGRKRRKQIAPIDVDVMRHSLAPGQIALAYFLHKGQLMLFALTRESVQTFAIPQGGDQLERLLPLFHAHLQPGGWHNHVPPQQPVRRLLSRLYTLLIGPVAHLFNADTSLLTIIPYGPLHNFPFHALYDGERFLVERYQINYLPATSLLPRYNTEQTTEEYKGGNKLSSLHAPLLFGYSDHGQLPRAVEEVELLSQLIGGTCFLEEEATIAHLVQQASGSALIHLATHGRCRLDAPNFSSVLLADGYLTALDVFGLALPQCQLVTLSGCETGVALSSGGDEQLGLGRAFLAAGASSLVMSLWPVEDNATSELMQLFYQELLRGASKVQALRTAQCALIQHPYAAYAHPYFWSAFRLVGDTGPLLMEHE